MECLVTWPLNASRMFVCISWASCPNWKKKSKMCLRKTCSFTNLLFITEQITTCMLNHAPTFLMDLSVIVKWFTYLMETWCRSHHYVVDMCTLQCGTESYLYVRVCTVMASSGSLSSLPQISQTVTARWISLCCKNKSHCVTAVGSKLRLLFYQFVLS